MTLQDTLHIGPLNLSVRYLVVFVSAALGYAVMSLLFVKRPPVRKAAGNRFVNAILTFVVIWKLEPPVALLTSGIFHGRIDWSAVGLQFFVPGGALAALLGLTGGLFYLVGSIFLTRSEQPPRIAVLSVAAAVLPAAVLYFAASALLSPAPVTTDSASARPRAIGTEVGDSAPAFQATTLEGTKVSFEGSAGKTIVLNFWATWCPPCRAELPDLVKFSSSPQGSRVQVWAVDMTGTESSAAAVRSFAANHGMRFPVLTDPTGSLARTFQVSAVPTTYIISPEGVIQAKQVGAMSPSWLRRQTAIR